MKYFLKIDDKFMYYLKKSKVLINNSYTNDKTCVSLEDFVKRQLSYILEIAPTHATECNG